MAGGDRSSPTSSLVLGLPLGSKILFSIILITFIHKRLKLASGAPVSQGPRLSQHRLLCVGLPMVPHGFGSGSDICIAKGALEFGNENKGQPLFTASAATVEGAWKCWLGEEGHPHPLSPSLFLLQPLPTVPLIIFPIFFPKFWFL